MIPVESRTKKLFFGTHLHSYGKLNGCNMVFPFLLILISANRVKIDERGDSSLVLALWSFVFFSCSVFSL